MQRQQTYHPWQLQVTGTSHAAHVSSSASNDIWGAIKWSRGLRISKTVLLEYIHIFLYEASTGMCFSYNSMHVT